MKGGLPPVPPLPAVPPQPAPPSLNFNALALAVIHLKSAMRSQQAYLRLKHPEDADLLSGIEKQLNEADSAINAALGISNG